MRTMLVIIAVGLAPACSSSKPTESKALYMDVHDLGPGNVTAAAVAKAHAQDLAVEGRHGVEFLRYWVDEEHGKVYCLSKAPSAGAVIDTHREAHGLLPEVVGLVSAGE